VLELVGAVEVAIDQQLLDLPVEPQRGAVDARPVFLGGGGTGFKEVVGIFAARQVQHAQLHFPGVHQIFDRGDRPLSGFRAGSVGVEIEHDLFRVGVAQHAAQLVLSQRGAEGGDGVVDAGGVEGDRVEVALNNDGAVLFGDRVAGAIEGEQGFAFVE